MMTRRHFEKLAKILGENKPTARANKETLCLWLWDRIRNSIETLCEEENPLFDIVRFREAIDKATDET